MSDKESYQYIIVKGYIHIIPTKNGNLIVENKSTEDPVQEKENDE